MGLLRRLSNFFNGLWTAIKSLAWEHLEEPEIQAPIPPFYAPPELIEIPHCRDLVIKWLISRCGGILPFSAKFRVPLKTVQDWSRGRRLPRIYVIQLFQLAILYEEKLEHIKRHTKSGGAETIKAMY